MKKIILGISFLILSTELFAVEAVVVCRTTGLMQKTVDVASVDCGNISGFECEEQVGKMLMDKYNENTVYNAMADMCDKITGGRVWYPHKLDIRY